ncbi:TetR/AcrR family transcriptional regulator [Mucilaginibacter sp.]
MTGHDDIIHEEILQAALRLFRKYGPTKVTMDNLAKATGRSRSALYYYFKNRDEVFQAVLERIPEDIAAEIRVAVNAAANLNDKIYAFCLIKINTAYAWKRVFSAMEQVMSADEISRHTKFIDAMHKKLMYLEGGILAEILSAQGHRIVGSAEQDMLVFIISSGVRGIRREVYEYNDPHDAKAAVQLLSDMVTKWLQL